MNTCLLISGGIDSYLTYHILKQRPDLLGQPKDLEFDSIYIDLNTPYSEKEIMAVQTYCDSNLKVIDAKSLNLNQIDPIGGFIPNRNLLFATLASAYGYTTIFICAVSEDRIQDGSEYFRLESSKLLSYSLQKEIKLVSPVSQLTKIDLANIYLDNDLGNSDDLMFKTFSCYNPGVVLECLSCKACFRKNVVLNHFGFFRSFNDLELVKKYRDDETIDKKRKALISNYVNHFGRL